MYIYCRIMIRVVRNISVIFIASLITITSADAVNNVVIESAMGLGSPVTPFSSRWSGSVGSDGLSFKEYAARISYSPIALIGARCAFGWLEYYHKDDYRVMLDMPPEPYHFGSPGNIIKAIYINPTARITLPMLIIDAGAILNDNNDDGNWFYQAEGTLEDKFYISPSAGLELGDEKAFILGRLFDSFPMISGGGFWEFGIGYRTSRDYEHELYVSTFGTEMIGLGYRGEFRLHGQTGLSFGFQAGGDEHENIYSFTLGFNTVLGGPDN